MEVNVNVIGSTVFDNRRLCINAEENYIKGENVKQYNFKNKLFLMRKSSF